MKRNWILAVALAAPLAAGTLQASNCEFQKTIDLTLDLAGSEQLTIAAVAGDLEVTGRADLDEARIHGKVCASEEQWLEDTGIVTEGGREASIAVETPEVENGWSFFNTRYLYVDLEIDVPTAVALDIRDSSGDLTVRGTGPVNIRDSSGDIELEDVDGSAVLKDSSGDIKLRHIAGDVTVRQDSSGDIYGRDIQGSVLVEHDSSGDIRFEEVLGDYVVERDSSGDIVAETVGGAFRVLNDGSGDVSYTAVSGEVEVPEEG
jgi:DUF4097 and DUF4098 domain-containing protein YvlB